MASNPGKSSPSPENEVIPGTVHLVDLEGTMHTRHAEGGQRDIVLVPTPSDDPDDPLNWTPRRKLLSTTCSKEPFHTQDLPFYCVIRGLKRGVSVYVL